MSDSVISTADLCDQYPARVLALPLRDFGGTSAFSGEVVTIKCFEDNSVVKETAATQGHGRVIVVDGGGSLRRALLGDMIAANAVQNGWAGFVIYGCVRDSRVLAGLSIGVKALGTIPVKTDKRGIGDLNIPLAFGGVTINPGDTAYADEDGVIFYENPVA